MKRLAILLAAAFLAGNATADCQRGAARLCSEGQ